jgi:hypothetical protein
MVLKWFISVQWLFDGVNFAWGGVLLNCGLIELISMLPIACVSPSSVFGRPSGEEEERRIKGRGGEERRRDGKGES